MLRAEVLDAALGYERRLYRYLTELSDLTAELAEAVNRQDAVAVRLFLKLRQEQLSQASEQKRSCRVLCRDFSEAERARLLALLNGEEPSAAPEEEPLVQQVSRNRKLLAQVVAADRQVSLLVQNQLRVPGGQAAVPAVGVRHKHAALQCGAPQDDKVSAVCKMPPGHQGHKNAAGGESLQEIIRVPGLPGGDRETIGTGGSLHNGEIGAAAGSTVAVFGGP